MDIEFEIWEPSIIDMKPRGVPLSLCTWWCYYFTKILLHRPSYAIFFISMDKAIIHYTLTSFKSFKFPFMNDDDVQIGPSWTTEEYRNGNIASRVILSIIEHHRSDTGNFYWIAREENIASRSLVEKLAFKDCGEIKRNMRLGILPIFEP